MSDQHSEVDQGDILRLKRRKTRVELDKEHKRIRRLININTEDMKFYKRPEDYGSRPKHLLDKQSQKQEEAEVRNAKFLLIRLRNEETNLRKSAFEREKKGFDEGLFEEDSQQHKQTIMKEKQRLKRNIQAMTTQYKQ